MVDPNAYGHDIFAAELAAIVAYHHTIADEQAKHTIYSDSAAALSAIHNALHRPPMRT